jgi:DNA-binding transcriptional regulator YhcF (GntR family)
MNSTTRELIELVTSNPNKYSRQDIADSLDINYDTVRKIAKKHSLSGLFIGERNGGIIKAENSTLKGDEAMSELTNAQTQALLEECKANGIDTEDVKYYWHKSKKISMFVVGQKRPTYDTVREEIVASMKKHAPKYAPVKYKKVTDGHLLVIDPADIHVGKLSIKSETGYTYNMKLAVNMVHEGITGLLAKAQGFPIDRIMLIVGNDVLHRDNPQNTTTSGTRQDSDGMWHEAFIHARKMYVDIIEKLVKIAPVDVVFNPSNHDYASGYMLTDALYCWFNNHKQVTFDANIIHRKYYQYGENLILTSHGDGAKFADMPLLMASEKPLMWAHTNHRYVYLHHLHHHIQHKFLAGKDFPGVTVQFMRSPSASDSWHHKSGYTGAPQAIEGFIHHPTQGRVAQLCHIFLSPTL